MRKLLLALALGACRETDPNIDLGPDAAAATDDDAGFPCDPSGLSKGPWSLAMTQTSITVRWETCRSVPTGLSLSPESGGAPTRADAAEAAYVVKKTYTAGFPNAAPPDWAGTWYMHEAKLAGLQPGTCYRYALDVDANAKGRFCTSHVPGEPIRFLAIGDTDANLGHFTRDVLAQTVPKNPDFTIHGGDIEYYADPQETWASWFPVMAPLFRQGAFLAAMGNHEFEKATEFDDYSARFFGGAGDGDDHRYRFSSGGVWFFMIDTEDALDLSSDQGSWLASSLADAAKQPGFRFSAVVMHRPFLTCGDSDEHSAWLTTWAPLFDQYKVLIVFQAHMHGYERFEYNGRTFVTTAGGGGVIVDPLHANESRPYCNARVAAAAAYHAMIVDVTAGKLSAIAVDDSGKTVDQFEHAVP